MARTFGTATSRPEDTKMESSNTHCSTPMDGMKERQEAALPLSMDAVSGW